MSTVVPSSSGATILRASRIQISLAAGLLAGIVPAPAMAAGSNQPTTSGIANTADRGRGEWTTTMIVPKPGAPLTCHAAIKVSGTATADSNAHAELQARHNAIESWRRQVSDRYGYDFTHWWRAREKDVVCRDVAGATTCEALAAPCKSDGNNDADGVVRSGLGAR